MTPREMAEAYEAKKKKGKRLWWLKLPKDFFTSNNVIKKMRKLPGGDTYVVITLKLLLLSLDNDFRIYYEGVEDTFPKDIALTLDESPEAVEVTLRMLLQQGCHVDGAQAGSEGRAYCTYCHHSGHKGRRDCFFHDSFLLITHCIIIVLLFSYAGQREAFAAH